MLVPAPFKRMGGGLSRWWARGDTLETALVLILLVWGSWGVAPLTRRYLEQPAFAGMLHFAPAGVWSVGMLGVAGLVLGAGLGGWRRGRIAGLLAMLAIWGAILVALWSSPVPPPGAGITIIYMLLTCHALWRRGTG